jgi:hypothetical protein
MTARSPVSRNRGAAKPKRTSFRAIRAGRTYTIEEVANLLNLSGAAVRSWVKAGLPILKSNRPYLIIGEDLIGFLTARQKSAKRPLAPDQLYCLRCKTQTRPDGGLVDAIRQNGKTLRLVGLCETCGGMCNRMIGRKSLPDFETLFTVMVIVQSRNSGEGVG